MEQVLPRAFTALYSTCRHRAPVGTAAEGKSLITDTRGMFVGTKGASVSAGLGWVSPPNVK